MINKVLVTYASRNGSTSGVADAIGKALSEDGFTVDVQPIREVKDISSYHSVIAGSAIQNVKWLPEALEFISAHKAELSAKTFAAYLVCMSVTMCGEGNYEKNIIDMMEPVRFMVRPVEEGFFAGAFDINKVPSFSKRLSFRIKLSLGLWKEGDYRDWEAIRTWVNDLEPSLRS